MLRENDKKLYAALESASGFHPEDDLEVLGLEHFLLPGGFLLAGLSAGFLVLLGEILVKKYQDRKPGRKGTQHVKGNETVKQGGSKDGP